MKVLVLVSGGIDSTTCLALAANEYGRENVSALSMYYGQKHYKELECARRVAEYYGADYMELNLSSIFEESSCSLLRHSSEDIPKESYADQLNKRDGVPVSTYVPFRNGLFLSCAASMALSYECSCIYYGAHQDDSAGSAYPDCSMDFFENMNRAIFEGSGKQVHLEAPFIQCSKAGVIETGLRLHVPYELTWSCYSGGDTPCGRCATCIDRQKAFEANHVQDPALQGI